MMKRFFSKHAEMIRQWLTHRHLPIILACVGIVLTLPTLGTGLVADDYFHRAMLLEQWQGSFEDASLFGLFSFFDGSPERTRALMELDGLPWWAFEEIRAAFWRPLTELTHWFDYQLWADAPWLMHAHSLLWFGAAIWMMAHLYRKIIGPVWVAGLAGLLFAIDNSHSIPVLFIANRNALIAAFFGGLALLAHARWRQEGWRQGAVWGPLCYTLGLLSKESALAIGAYLFAYTLFLDRGSVRRKIKGFLPYVIITFSWYLTYRALGFGTWGTGDYIDPGRQPLLFASVLFERLPILLLGQFAGLPAELYGIDFYKLFPYGNEIIWGVAVVALALISLILFPLFRRDAVVRFWTVGMLLGLVPVCAAFPSNRLLFFSGIGAMGMIARFLVSWFEQPAWLPERQFRKRSARLLCLLFVVVHLILAPLTLPVISIGSGILNHHFLRQVVSMMPDDEDLAQKNVVLVNPPLAFGVMFLSQTRAAHGCPRPAHTWSLASGLLPLTITRIDERTVDIEVKQGLLQLTLDQFFRGPSTPMHVGQRIVLSGMSIEVLALAEGWQPSRARFRFAVPLDDPSLLLLQWKGGKFVPYTPPAAGESESL